MKNTSLAPHIYSVLAPSCESRAHGLRLCLYAAIWITAALKERYALPPYAQSSHHNTVEKVEVTDVCMFSAISQFRNCCTPVTLHKPELKEPYYQPRVTSWTCNVKPERERWRRGFGARQWFPRGVDDSGARRCEVNQLHSSSRRVGKCIWSKCHRQ